MKMTNVMTDGATGMMPAAAATPVLLVLESYPADMLATGPALPPGSPQFATACRRWRVSPATLARVPRVNALERAPTGRHGSWEAEARRRVAEALAATRPRIVVAAGWVARDALVAVLRPGASRLAWLTPATVETPDGHRVSLLAVPHYSTRGRLLNDAAVREATAAALRAALSVTH
jgi:hypothetical protein